MPLRTLHNSFKGKEELKSKFLRNAIRTSMKTTLLLEMKTCMQAKMGRNWPRLQGPNSDNWHPLSRIEAVWGSQDPRQIQWALINRVRHRLWENLDKTRNFHSAILSQLWHLLKIFRENQCSKEKRGIKVLDHSMEDKINYCNYRWTIFLQVVRLTRLRFSSHQLLNNKSNLRWHNWRVFNTSGQTPRNIQSGHLAPSHRSLSCNKIITIISRSSQTKTKLTRIPVTLIKRMFQLCNITRCPKI